MQNHEDELSDRKKYHFTKNFRSNNQKILFKKAKPHAKTLQIIAKLLKKNQSNDILVICDNLSKKRLQEDLEYFIKDDIILLDSSKKLSNQKSDGLILLSYKQITSMESKFVILLDTDISPQNEVNYALNLSTDSSFIIFENESDDIKRLRIKYENK